MFVAASLGICGTIFAGPIDNANEFVDKAVAEAEERNNPPMGQSDDSAPISWENEASGTDSAVNTGTADSTAGNQ